MGHWNMHLRVALVLGVALLGLGSAQNGADPVVETTAGKVRGIEIFDTTYNRWITAFYGIPFASPPVGDLRFRVPRPVPSWNDVINCTYKKPFQTCPQFPVDGLWLGREDCLYMNIYIPAKWSEVSTSSFPAFFWIYGGAYVLGDNDEFGWYDGKNLAASRQVIVVEPNYRIGALGFLASDALQRESGGTTGNMALQDQQEALRFAFYNIDRFGGNRNEIMIAGESAGAMSVCWHYVSQESRKYFKSAVMESGSCSSGIFFNLLPRAKAFGVNIAKQVGCSVDDLVCLRGKRFQDFFVDHWVPTPIPGTNHSIVPPLLWAPYGPAIDGDPRGLMARPIDILPSLRSSHKPLILGTNKDEGNLFLDPFASSIPGVSRPFTDQMVEIIVRHFFNESTTEDVMKQYQGVGNSNDHKVALIIRDFMFLCANDFAAEAISGTGTRTFLYQFVMDIPIWIDWQLMQDYHTIEMSFVFDNQWPPLVHPFGTREKEMAAHIGVYWTNLVRFGDVNGGDTPMNWPQYDAKTQRYLELDVPLRAADHLQYGTCNFWRYRKEKFYYE